MLCQFLVTISGFRTGITELDKKILNYKTGDKIKALSNN